MINRLPNIDRLKVFHLVYRTGSVTAAAEEAHLTKAAISQALKLLQEELGETLFVRRGRSLAPTEAARSLFKIVEPFLQTLSDRYAKAEATKGPVALLRISAPPLFSAKYLLPAVVEFRKAYPLVRFQIEETAGISPLRQLEDDHLDFCIADSFDVMFGKRSHFAVRELITDPERVICSRQYWDNRFGKTPTYEQLLQSEYISYHLHGAELCSWLSTLFGRGPKRLSPVLVVDRPDAVLFAVQKHAGLGLVPVSMLGRLLKIGTVVPIGGKKGIFQNRIVIVSLKGKRESVAHTLFLEHLESQ